MTLALVVGMLAGIALGAALVDVWFVQPMQRENRDLARAARRFEVNARDWQRLYQESKQFHAGTPYLPSTVERAKVLALIAQIKEQAEADTDDHSKAAELRVVQ